MIEIDNELSQKMRAMSFFMAILVVMIHIPFGGTSDSIGHLLTAIIQNGFARIAVPYFFLAAGFFLAAHVGEPGWWGREVKKRLRSLILPLIVLNGAWLIVLIAWRIAPNLIHHRALFADARIDLLLWEGVTSFGAYGNHPLGYGVLNGWPSALGLNPFAHPFLIQTWFLRSLFLLVCISPVIAWGREGSVAVAFLLNLFLCPFTTSAHPPYEIFLHMTFSLEGLFYFSAGMLLRQKAMPMVRHQWRIWSALSLALSSVAIICSFVYQGNLGMWSGYARFFIKPILLISVWQLLPPFKLPAFVSSCAFPMYLLHLCVLWALRLVLPCSAASFGAWLLLSLEVVLASIVSTWLLRKGVPRFARGIFGGR